MFIKQKIFWLFYQIKKANMIKLEIPPNMKQHQEVEK